MLPACILCGMRGNKVIYVGKAKKLKNRVSQYFQGFCGPYAKNRAMVSKIDHFDVIVAASEFEALVLECSLIKRYLPKYNILLKDDKGYPLPAAGHVGGVPQNHRGPQAGPRWCGLFWAIWQLGRDSACAAHHSPDPEAAGLQQAVPRDLGKDRPLPELPHEPVPRLVPAEPEPGGLPGCHGAGPAAAHRELPEAGPGAAGTDAGGLGGAEI